MARLEGKIIALTGPRKAEELGRMVNKFGGTTLLRPAQGTVFLDDTHIENQLKALIEYPADWIILTTGVGTEALMQTADKLGLASSLWLRLDKCGLRREGTRPLMCCVSWDLRRRFAMMMGQRLVCCE